MSATSIDLSQIKTDALSAASTFRTLIGLGTSDTPTFKAATLSAGTLNGTVLDIAQTWGGTGTYTGIRYNVTDSGPANAASLLLDLQVGGSSKFSVSRTGLIRSGAPYSSATGQQQIGDSNGGISFSSGGSYFNIGGSALFSISDAGFIARSTQLIGFTSGAADSGYADTYLTRDAAGTLAQRNDTSAQTFRIYKTYSGGGTNFERWSISGANILFEKGGSGQDQDISIGNTTAFSTAIRGEAIHFRKANNSTTWWSISTAGHFIAGTDNTYDIGASGATRPRRVYIGGGSLTGSQADSSIEISPTWNTTGTPTAFKLNVTDTASNAASLLMDLQVGGSSKFKVDKAGAATFTGLVSATANVEHRLGQSVVWGDGDWGARWKWSGGGNGVGMAVGSFLPAVSSAMSLGEWGYTGWTNLYLATGANGANNGVVLVPDSVHTLGIRNGTSAQALRIYNTTDAGLTNYERAKIAWESNVLKIGTEGLGTGASNPRAMEFQTNGTTRLTVSSTGDVNALQLSAGTGGAFTSYALTVNGNILNRFADASSIRAFMGRLSDWMGSGTSQNFCFSAYTAETHFFVNNQYIDGQQALILKGSEVAIGKQLTNALGTITASTPLTLTQTWNNNATTFTGLLANFTDTASASGSLLMDLQVGGSSKLSVSKAGVITLDGAFYGKAIAAGYTWGRWENNFTGGVSLQIRGDAAIGWGSGQVTGAADLALYRDAAGILAQRNGTSAQALRIYNTTDAGLNNYERAKIAWESNVLQIGTEKLGTGSARALELQTDGTTRLTISTTGAFTIADALNVSVGTTTGTKIGTATTQKLSFYNSTPVVQPAAVADATDAASVITQLNLLLARMRDLGLIAT